MKKNKCGNCGNKRKVRVMDFSFDRSVNSEKLTDKEWTKNVDKEHAEEAEKKVNISKIYYVCSNCSVMEKA